MSTQQHDLSFDSREGDPVYHQPPPPGSGSADSFDTRHDEFPPERGHHGAAIDPKTGALIHGDRLPMEAPSGSWPHRHDAAQPSHVSDGDADRLERKGDHWSEAHAGKRH